MAFKYNINTVGLCSCGEDEHPVNELLVLQLGDEHPNGRYNNISLCKIFGKHLNSEKESPSRENGKYPV